MTFRAEPMTFQGELVAVARGLARVAAQGTSRLTDTELDVALLARSAVLELAAVVHRDLTGSGAHGLHPTLADLETHPVRAMYQALRGHQPVPVRAAPTDVLSADLGPGVPQAWKGVAQHALAASLLWQTATLTAPEPPVAWAGIRDLASVAAAVAELDAELADAAAALPGRREHADKLAKAVTSGLRTAAREAALLAESGPLAATGPEPRPRAAREVVAVRTPRDAIAAQTQLAGRLRSARHLRPERVAVITLGHRRTVEAVLQTWRDLKVAVDPRLRQAMTAHQDLLARASGRRWRAASIDGGDPWPLRQAEALRAVLQPDHPVLRQLLRDPALTQEFVAALADTTTALSEVTEAHLRRKAWLCPVADGDTVVWRPAASWHDVPRPTQALRAASVHAEHLRAAAAVPGHPGHPGLGAAPAAAGRRPPQQSENVRQALSPAPHRPLLPRTPLPRPPRPGVPPRPVAPSHVERQLRR